MPTRLYLHAAANDLSGTFPTTPSATISITYQYSLAATLRKMDTTIGASQASGSATTAASLATQVGFVGQWVSPALAAGTYGGAGVTLNVNYAHAENNASADIGESVRMHCRFWRPSTGAQVGVYWAYASGMTGSAEPGAIDSERVNSAVTTATTGVTVQDGDVLIVELFSRNGQAASNSYIGHFYYDGTTENTTLNAVVSNHAAFFETSETLSFLSTGISGGGSMTLGAITAAGDGTVTIDGASSQTVGAVTTSSAGTVDITGASTQSVGAVTTSSAGGVAIDGASTQSVGAVTTTAAGDVAVAGTEESTLGILTLVAEGTVTDGPAPQPAPGPEVDEGAGSGAPRRVFKIPEHEPRPFALDDLYPQDRPGMPPAGPMTDQIVYAPLATAMGAYAPPRPPVQPLQSPRVELPEDDDFYEMAGVLAMLL